MPISILLLGISIRFCKIVVACQLRVHVTVSSLTTKACYGVFFTALQRLQEGKITSMEISFLDSSILDESIEVVIDFNSNEVLTSTPIVKKQKVDLFACPSCAYNTNSRGNLYRHKRSVHQKKKEECPTCGKTYASPYDLRTHVRVVHLLLLKCFFTVIWCML